MSRGSNSRAVFLAGTIGRDLAVVVGVLMILTTLPVFAENWPGFRGPTGQPQFLESRPH